MTGKLMLANYIHKIYTHSLTKSCHTNFMYVQSNQFKFQNLDFSTQNGKLKIHLTEEIN